MITVTIKELERSQVEITGEIPVALFDAEREAAIKQLNQEIEIDGFRKGNVPEKILLEKVGEDRVLLEMAELALAKAYPEIIVENKIEAIGRPQINLNKLAKGNPLGFTIITAVMPKMTLPDYKKIAKAVMSEPEETVEADEADVDKMIAELQKSRAVKVEGSEEPSLPEVTDEFAKSLGKFENVSDLRAKIKENLTLERVAKAKEKKRLKTVEQIATEAKLELPEILVESELDKMIGEMRFQIEQMGLTFDAYLEHLKKTEADLRTAWKTDAEKRVRFGITMQNIATTEKITPAQEDLEKELAHLVGHHPDVDPGRLRAYAENVLTSEKVFEFLEGQK